VLAYLSPSIGIPICVVLIIIGSLLIFRAYKRRSKILIQNQMDNLRKERKDDRATHFNRDEILNTLVQLHRYITDGVGKQQITELDFKSIKEQFTTATFNVSTAARIFIMPVLLRLSPKLFIKMAAPIIPNVMIKLDVILQPYNLGSLPITESEPYKTSRKRLAEMGLSPRLNLMINNYISLSELSGIALLIPQFFQIGHPTKFALRRVGHFLPHLPKIIDEIMSNLLSAISEELEKFLQGE